MSTRRRDYLINVKKRYTTLSDDLSLSYPCHDSIQINLRFRRIPHDDPEFMIELLTVVPHSDLQSDDTAPILLSPVFTAMKIPRDDQIPLIREISWSASEMNAVRICRVCHHQVMPEIIMLILNDTRLSPDETEAAAALTRLVPDRLAAEAASRLTCCIGPLEKVVLDGSGSVNQCGICLENFCVGLEVERVPCSHMYHHDCLLQWLRRSNLCPLCRYEIPSCNLDYVRIQ